MEEEVVEAEVEQDDPPKADVMKCLVNGVLL